MEMDGSFKIFVKNGDYGYKDNSSSYGVMDYVAEYESFVEGLRDFIEWADGSDTKVVLTYKPQKAKSKKKAKKF